MGVYRIPGVRGCCYFRGFVVVFLIVWRLEYSLILVCMHHQRNAYQSRKLHLLRNCLSDGQDGRCKQRGQTVTIWWKALLMPRLAVCSRDLYWHWINWTLLCDTMEVSMLRLAWLPIAQHVFQPALTGRLELISRKIVSSEQEQRLSQWADFAKNCLPRIECKELLWFREKYCALGHRVCKICEIGGQKKWGPTCDRDISNSAIYTTALYRAYTVLGGVHNLSRETITPVMFYYRLFWSTNWGKYSNVLKLSLNAFKSKWNN